MFIVTLHKYDGSTSYNYNYFAALRMSDAGSVTHIYNHRDDGHVIYSSSMSAIVPCNQGEHVWVEMKNDDRRIIDASHHYNQFSGLLIREGLE